VDQEGAMRRGGADGARNWRGEATETTDGRGQRSGEEKRNAGAREGIEERRSLLGAFPS
jgi:hypothetical protein